MGKITFNKADIPFRLKNKANIISGISALFVEEGRSLNTLNIITCSDDYLLELNKNYLQHDYYTDILTFDLSESPEQIDGELYISIDRVSDNAQELKTSVVEEYLRVIIHGCLHLCGYKDKTKLQIKQMRAREAHYLSLPMFHVEHIK